ncbi:Predicted esterase [Catalinimonas alkaloidigena]|uniref:Predicted esterase n=1 Tax=Catalinimonas alkaloidigena TaxID=1075417 RepID=A0A1G8Y0Q1_9BACT|nr:hypothetical protein [Catalinimonas alkaloidigena]SDJ96373.1 Predicted esterase [Catalinimonas alkaloidigena]
MQTHHLAVTKTARYTTLGSLSDQTQEVWFVCHGYGQLAPYFIRHFQALDDGTRFIVAPEALSRFYLEGVSGRVGATWMTREDRLHDIQDYTQYLTSLYKHLLEGLSVSTRITLLGFSQGAATACRWVATGQVHVDRLILWAGQFPPDIDMMPAPEALEGKELVLVTGRTDAYITPEVLQEQHALLERRGLPYRHIWFSGGHTIDADTLCTLV